jgi:hypothetical protein
VSVVDGLINWIVGMSIVFSAARHTTYVYRVSIKDGMIQIAVHVIERVGRQLAWLYSVREMLTHFEGFFLLLKGQKFDLQSTEFPLYFWKQKLFLANTTMSRSVPASRFTHVYLAARFTLFDLFMSKLMQNIQYII